MDDGTLSRAFAALADPTRRDLISRLTLGDAAVGELAASYDMSLQAVSKHIAVLESAGLVTRRRDAQRRLVHLDTEVLGELTHWIDRNHRAAEARLSRLDAVLQATGSTGPTGSAEATGSAHNTRSTASTENQEHPS